MTAPPSPSHPSPTFTVKTQVHDREGFEGADRQIYRGGQRDREADGQIYVRRRRETERQADRTGRQALKRQINETATARETDETMRFRQR